MTGYIFTHEGQGFSPEGKTSLNPNEHNKALEARELAEWAAQPDRFCAYIARDKFTTWLGTELGTIIRSNTFRNNFGSRTTSVRIRGTNGATYYGRYGSDWSQFVSVRKAR